MASIAAGQQAPDFQLSDLNGESVRLSEMRGAPVVLNFFHTGCTWCRAMIPQLDAVYDRLENIEIPILGIAVGEDTVELGPLADAGTAGQASIHGGAQVGRSRSC